MMMDLVRVDDALPTVFLSTGTPPVSPRISSAPSSPIEESNGAGGGMMSKKPPLSQGGNGGWDSWDNDDSFRSPTDMRRNQSAGDFKASGARCAPAKSKSSEDIYSRSQLEASAANKESFFAKRMAENESKPEGLPPSQGGKYVGFGSSPGPAPRSNQQAGGGGDVFSVMSEVNQWPNAVAHSGVLLYHPWFTQSKLHLLKPPLGLETEFGRSIGDTTTRNMGGY